MPQPLYNIDIPTTSITAPEKVEPCIIENIRPNIPTPKTNIITP